MCHLTVLSNNYGFFLMGLPIFMGYYTVHNMDDPSIGYIPIDTSSKPYVTAGNIPTRFLLPIVHNYWVELGPSIIIVILAGLCFYFLVPKYRDWWGDKSWKFYTACGVNVLVLVLLYFFVIIPLINHFFGDEKPAEIPDDPTKINSGDSTGAVTKLLAGVSGLLAVKMLLTKKPEDEKPAKEIVLPEVEHVFLNVMH